MTAPIIKRVSKVAEAMVLFYLGVTIYIIAMNINMLPEVFMSISRNVFGYEQATGGFELAQSRFYSLGINSEWWFMPRLFIHYLNSIR